MTQLTRQKLFTLPTSSPSLSCFRWVGLEEFLCELRLVHTLAGVQDRMIITDSDHTRLVVQLTLFLSCRVLALLNRQCYVSLAHELVPHGEVHSERVATEGHGLLHPSFSETRLFDLSLEDFSWSPLHISLDFWLACCRCFCCPYLSPHPSPLLSQPVHGERLCSCDISSSYSGTVNTVKEELLPPWHSEHSERGELSESELPCTHPSFLGTKGPLTSGNLMPPAQAPNPPRTGRSLHLTSSAQRPQWRDYRHCARNPQRRTYLYFLPIQRRPCSKQGFSVSHTSTSQARRRVPVRPKGNFLSHHVQTDQSTCFVLLFRLRCRARPRSTHQKTIGSFFRARLSHGSK